ncbi:MAG: hypothetical protein ACRDHW_23870, partial [Ktedonobacteraceae bacterium]
SHLRFYLDMNPISLRENLAEQLIERGFCPAPNGPFLYGLPSISSHEVQAADIEVRETRDVDLFLELWAESFEFPRDSFTNTLKDLKRGPFSLPENHLYIAYVEGMPAAIGALYIKDGIGHLNAGGTLPAFRKRGCHTALTTHRIAASARFHCELMTGDTGSLGSISQVHMQQAGLQIAFTRITWVCHSP